MDRTPRFVALTLAAALTVAGCSSATTTPPSSQAGRSTDKPPTRDATSMPPWSAPTDVPARVASAGLDLGPMGTAEHYHPQLRIFINGAEVPVPGNIGVDPATGAMSAVHTHEEDGTIHIEADTTGEVFTLGQLFTQWGVKLTPTQIGGARAKPGQAVNVTNDGNPVAGDPMKLLLRPEQKIVLRLG